MENLIRLRLQYEDSVGRCEVCRRRGLIGSTLKLFDDPVEAGIEYSAQDVTFHLRCADRADCRLAINEEEGLKHYSSIDIK